MRVSVCLGPIRRREFLQLGSLALGGLSLTNVLAGRAAAGTARRDTSVILLYLHGGPTQLETYDLKPDAPVEYRSIYQPIATNVPGMDICEKFPLQAKIADKFSLVRSLHHSVGIHSDGGIIVLTGKMPSKLDPTSQSKSEHPDFGMVTAKVRGPHPNSVPQHIAIPAPLYMTRPAYLGDQFAPFTAGNPSAQGYTCPIPTLSPGATAGFAQRKQLRDQIDRLRRDLAPSLETSDEFRQRAFDMLTSTATTEAFDLSKEPDALRDRYGRHLWGQGCLLARRLAEAGTAVISLYIDAPENGQDFTNWDDHIQNAGRPGHFGKFLDVRLPYLDQALSALIEDIFQRGVDERILVVVMGEFGRTPRLSHNVNGTGRDHWPDAYTALVSGGGLRMGQVIGATNSKAEYPTERPYGPHDLLATVYRHLGVDTQQMLTDHAGRPVPILGDGTPITELA
ncbi:MAG: DUF1501 domain-containing protein [Planctomycetaceae bacterium]